MEVCRKVRLHMRRLVYQDGATPLPCSILLAMFAVAVFSTWITTIVMSFLPKLVRWFGMKSVDTGFNVGITDTSLYIGAFISSVVWGYLSDRKGRWWSLMATSGCCLVTTLAFGFSRGLWWAVVTRFLQGFSVGQVLVLKGMLKELCDDTNLAVGMTVVLTAPALGSIIGPTIGGFTAFPHQLYPDVFTKNSLFGRFPALLPNLIIATGLGLGMLLTILLIPKDEERKKSDRGETIALLQNDVVSYGDGFNSNNNIDIIDSDKDKSNNTNNEKNNSSSNNNSTNDGDNNNHDNNSGNSDIENDGNSRNSNLWHRLRNSDLVTVLKRRECLLCCILFILLANVEIGFAEMLPILASTDPVYKGMGLQPSDVGLLLTIVSAVRILFQLTLIPRISTFIGPQKFLIISNVIAAIFCPLVPTLALLGNRKMMWVGLVVMIFIVMTSFFTGYLCLDILVNNSVEVDVIGSALGVTMTASYLGRLLAPVMFGGIYSWSLKNIKGVPGNVGALGFPFDQFLTFFVMSFLSVICAIVTSRLPKRMNYVDNTSG